MSTAPIEHDLSALVATNLPQQRGLYYDGAWQAGSGRSERSYSPGSGEDLGTWSVASERDIDRAVASALRAFPAWRATPPLERAAKLRRVAEIIRANARELALIDAADCGNPVRQMMDDAHVAATQLEYFAGLVLELKGETIPTENGSLDYTLREPLGVVARITPFNHPFMFAAGKIAAPLAAGNTVIVKPPEQAPLSTLRLFELLEDVFPTGVLNCVTGDRDTGAYLAAHSDVAAIALIGSVAAGKSVMRTAAEGLKPVLLELGGKNAMIVYPDADFEAAAASAVRGMNFTWCGQSCGSTSRLFLHESIHDVVLDRIVELTGAAHYPGLPTDLRTTMGAVISGQQLDKAMMYIAGAVQEGARVVFGGGRPRDPQLAKGFYLEPTILADVLPAMRIAREEVFGPVLSVLRWSDEEELFAAVNSVEYGLTASIWTNRLQVAHAAAARVEAGYVWINNSSTHFIGAPFGGYKHSGMGREECKEELLAFTQVKNVNITFR
ncbi:betaine-aldehyde dehydrogenase [Paraburkholderia sp. BL23I1N1]|uniref:aldehyde dehydrogenase family protein n=1 Tax=Paraburkholderia sp. BL23I1N1 TaxID=1938802 RepID=UPI000E73D636|nr:aldehyde dehydrogenase family protein [Paraburkholderia sp. BL23I1N1]RKE38553.1 betaine-aldehyde dehydrogenase [Paraburkholderia sp. BL23I1N1]